MGAALTKKDTRQNSDSVFLSQFKLLGLRVTLAITWV